jgi:hypothetical protein
MIFAGSRVQTLCVSIILNLILILSNFNKTLFNFCDIMFPVKVSILMCRNVHFIAKAKERRLQKPVPAARHAMQ